MTARSDTSAPLRKIVVAASLLALAKLLTFPILGARRFTGCFRTSQALSQIQRHIFLAQPQAAPVVSGASCRAIYAPLADTEGAGQIKPTAGFQLADHVSLPRFLLRIRSGPSHKSLSDPLL